MEDHRAGTVGEAPEVELLKQLLEEQRKANATLLTMHHELRDMKVRLQELSR